MKQIIGVVCLIMILIGFVLTTNTCIEKYQRDNHINEPYVIEYYSGGKLVSHYVVTRHPFPRGNFYSIRTENGIVDLPAELCIVRPATKDD